MTIIKSEAIPGIRVYSARGSSRYTTNHYDPGPGYGKGEARRWAKDGHFRYLESEPRRKEVKENEKQFFLYNSRTPCVNRAYRTYNVIFKADPAQVINDLYVFGEITCANKSVTSRILALVCCQRGFYADAVVTLTKSQSMIRRSNLRVLLERSEGESQMVSVKRRYVQLAEIEDVRAYVPYWVKANARSKRITRRYNCLQ